jgi:hypothetical protein
MNLEEQMAARVRRHMVTSIGGVFGVIVVMFVLGAVARTAIGPDTHAPWMAVFPLVGILAIPAIGFWSTFRNLRCPSCEKLVIYQVSWNYSLFGGMASKTCRHCGQKIFGDLIQQRFRRMMIIMMCIGIGLGVLGAVANVMTHQH